MLAYAQSVWELAEEQIAEVTRLHDEALATGEVTGRMQALIKNVVENQRSVLDYTAQAVADKYGCGTNPYWIGKKTPRKFRTAMEENLPGILKNHQEIVDAFERHQPYQPDHDWVLHMFALNVENKHHRLTPQVGGDELWPQPLVKLTTTGSRIAGPTVVRVRWDFENPRVPVLATLERIQTGVQEAADHVCSEAGL